MAPRYHTFDILYPGTLVIPTHLDSSNNVKCFSSYITLHRAQLLVPFGFGPPPGEQALETPLKNETSPRGNPRQLT